MIKLLYPVPANSRITQTFAEHVARAIKNGWCPNPGTCPSGIYYYGGIDFGIPIGTPVHAMAAGEIIRAEEQSGGYGRHVRIQHKDNYLSVYGHLDSWRVKAGEEVKAGDLIGMSGNTGNSTGQHLHAELRLNGKPIDPMPLFVGYLEPDPIIEINIGDTIKLKDKYDYVNIRSGPSTKYIDCGDFLPGDIGVVVNKDGMWLCIFALKSGFGLWVHGDYVEKV